MTSQIAQLQQPWMFTKSPLEKVWYKTDYSHITVGQIELIESNFLHSQTCNPCLLLPVIVSEIRNFKEQDSMYSSRISVLDKMNTRCQRPCNSKLSGITGGRVLNRELYTQIYIYNVFVMYFHFIELLHEDLSLITRRTSDLHFFWRAKRDLLETVL